MLNKLFTATDSIFRNILQREKEKVNKHEWQLCSLGILRLILDHKHLGKSYEQT